MHDKMQILIYHPKRYPIPRSGNLSLDGKLGDRRVSLTLKPGQNKVDPEVWDAIKQRDDVRDLVESDKAIEEVQPPKPKEAAHLSKAERQLELETSDWRVIRDVAQTHGITEKPEGGWEEAIPFILAAEGY